MTMELNEGASWEEVGYTASRELEEEVEVFDSSLSK